MLPSSDWEHYIDLFFWRIRLFSFEALSDSLKYTTRFWATVQVRAHVFVINNTAIHMARPDIYFHILVD